MNLGILLGIVLCVLLVTNARGGSSWNEFEDVRGCHDDIRLYCERSRPKTNAILECLFEYYESLSLQCWHDLDFFAKKYPNSIWSRFEIK
jgi:hypothetical protein